MILIRIKFNFYVLTASEDWQPRADPGLQKSYFPRATLHQDKLCYTGTHAQRTGIQQYPVQQRQAGESYKRKSEDARFGRAGHKRTKRTTKRQLHKEVPG